MTNRIKQAAPLRKVVLASALAAMTLGSVSPAMAQGYPYGNGGYDNSYRHRDRGDTTGAAVIGGIVGIAIGALIASGGNKNQNRYRDRGWQWRDGYYWDREGRRYDRDGRQAHDTDGYYRGRDGYRSDGGYRGDNGYRGDDDGYYSRRGYRDGDGTYRGN